MARGVHGRAYDISRDALIENLVSKAEADPGIKQRGRKQMVVRIDAKAQIIDRAAQVTAAGIGRVPKPVLKKRSKIKAGAPSVADVHPDGNHPLDSVLRQVLPLGSVPLWDPVAGGQSK